MSAIIIMEIYELSSWILPDKCPEDQTGRTSKVRDSAGSFATEYSFRSPQDVGNLRYCEQHSVHGAEVPKNK
jgi:hypothetical protein